MPFVAQKCCIFLITRKIEILKAIYLMKNASSIRTKNINIKYFLISYSKLKNGLLWLSRSPWQFGLRIQVIKPKLTFLEFCIQYLSLQNYKKMLDISSLFYKYIKISSIYIPLNIFLNIIFIISMKLVEALNQAECI